MRAVVTALTVLEQIAERQPTGVSELARAVNLPKSTVQRALETLCQQGWVTRNGRTPAQWMLTGRLAALAMRAGAFDIRERARPIVAELHRRTDESVHLSVRSGDHMSIIDKIESSKTVRLYDPVGGLFPIHACSTGKAMLAWTAPAEVEEVIGRAGLERFNERTLTDVAAFMEELDEIRSKGYSVNRGEWRAEVRGVAAPLLSADGRPYGAVSVAVPEHRLPDADMEPLALMVKEVVDTLWTQ